MPFLTEKTGLPLLTIPFVMASFMFLAVSSGGEKSLSKTKDGRPPEYQLRRFHCRQREEDNVIWFEVFDQTQYLELYYHIL